MLYAHDTDEFPDETWSFFNKTKPRFEFVSLDCTGGAHSDLFYRAHMCLGCNISCHDQMCRQGLIDDRSLICLNHGKSFSHVKSFFTVLSFSCMRIDKCKAIHHRGACPKKHSFFSSFWVLGAMCFRLKNGREKNANPYFG